MIRTIECTAETAALYHYHDVARCIYIIHTKGGCALYTSVKMSETYQTVVLERICPIRNMTMKAYIDPDSMVVLIKSPTNNQAQPHNHARYNNRNHNKQNN